MTENRELATKYQEDRRLIDPAVYDYRRLSELPLPASQDENIQMIITPPSSPPNSPGIDAENEPEQHLGPILIDNSEEVVCVSDSMNVGRPPPKSPEIDAENEPEQHLGSILIDDSEEVICVSALMNVKRHRPMKEFDIISGRHPFLRTVIHIFHLSIF